MAAERSRRKKVDSFEALGRALVEHVLEHERSQKREHGEHELGQFTVSVRYQEGAGGGSHAPMMQAGGPCCVCYRSWDGVIICYGHCCDL